jgi:hypothetical protein
MGSAKDVLEWQLYTPEEICALAESFGLAAHLISTSFDEAQPASADHPRMQIVFEKVDV